MRTRSRSTDSSQDVSRYYTKQYPTYTPMYSPYYTATWQEVVDSIVDDPVPVWLGLLVCSVAAFKPVSQNTREITFKNHGMTYSFSGPPAGTAYDVRPTHVYCACAGVTSMDVGALMLTYGLGKVADYGDPMIGHYDRWEAFCKPSMRTRSNLAVFLAELKDIKRMINILPSKHFSFGNSPVRTWRDLLRYANDQHLNYNFGWKPFLKEFYNLLKTIENFDTRLRRFVNEQMRLVTKHAATSDEQSLSGNVTLNSNWKLTWETNYAIKRVSTFQFIYQLPDYTPNQLYYRAWADALGLNPTASNIWAIIPWSFVVDWFANISSMTDLVSPDWIEPWVTFIQACSSVKVTGECTVGVLGSAAWGSPAAPLATEKFRSYVRKVGTPNFTWDTGTLNADKIRLLASLALTKML